MSKRRFCYANFLKEPSVSIQAINTMAIATAANAQQDFFWVKNQYFDLTQGVGAKGANTLLAAVGLTPAYNGWLLTVDDDANDSIEITNGIVAGEALSFVTGTDAFYMQSVVLAPTVTTILHMLMGFRELGAYVDSDTYAAAAAAYDNKIYVGWNNNAGRIGQVVSNAGVDAAANATHAAATAADAFAIRIEVTAARVATVKIGHATPAGATYAQHETARLAAIADLAADATLVGGTLTTGITVVPTIIVNASNAGVAPDARWMSYEVGLL